MATYSYNSNLRTQSAHKLRKKKKKEKKREKGKKRIRAGRCSPYLKESANESISNKSADD